jgi:hypothetical protein
MRVRKKPSRDLGNGLIALSFTVDPADISDAYMSAPAQSALRMLLTIGETTHIITGLKAPIADAGDGSATVVVHVGSAHVPRELIFAPKGSMFSLSISFEPHIDPGMFPVTPEDRSKLLKTVAILCSEHAFQSFMEKNHDLSGLIARGRDLDHDVEQAAVEVLLRHIGAHSRAEILSNMIVAERAERIVRTYRRHQWNNLEGHFDPRNEAVA